MQVAFRTDASLQIGTGHVMRCLTLAEALRATGASCTFVCRAQPGHMGPEIAERGFSLRMLPSLPEMGTSFGSAPHAAWVGTDSAQDALDTCQALDGRQWDWLVVDHYGLEATWEKQLRSKCRQIAVLDDLADRNHDCDLLVDPGADPDSAASYAKLVPANATLLVGPQYCILRPEFDTIRETISTRSGRIMPHHLMVMFGGNDAAGHTMEALEAIADNASSGSTTDVVISKINQDRTRVAEFCARHPGFALHVATTEVAQLMARADLIVASGGGATWERLYLRRPALLKVIAENQRKPLESMAKAGLFRLYDHRRELDSALRGAFVEGVQQPADLVRNGVSDIARAMQHRLIRLGHPQPFDLRQTFNWLQDLSLRKQFLMRGDEPNRRGHFEYWRRLLSDTAQRAYSIRLGRRHIGNAGLRNIDPSASVAELWLYLGNPTERGNGVGKLVLQQLEDVIRVELGCRLAVVHVSQQNLPAYELYRHAGYCLSEHQDAIEVGFLAELSVVRMEKQL